eukprot:1332316-Rhodomonas_salina.2
MIAHSVTLTAKPSHSLKFSLELASERDCIMTRMGPPARVQANSGYPGTMTVTVPAPVSASVTPGLVPRP